AVNIFQLVKRFCVETSIQETRGALILDIGGLSFDASFVIAYTDFLRTSLIDTSLLDGLSAAVQGATVAVIGARPVLPDSAYDAAVATARRALKLLFDDLPSPGMFNVSPNTPIIPNPFASPMPDPNLVSTSFDASVPAPCLSDAGRNHLSAAFAILS